MTRILNEKEVSIWSPSSIWAMLDVVGLGFINKWRFTRFLNKHEYKEDYLIVNALIHFSAYQGETRSVVCKPDTAVSINECPTLLILEEIGDFDGDKVYFAKVKDKD